MVRIKICGMMSLGDIETCARAGVDAVGFIFASGARRLQIDAAAQLTRAVPPFVTSVGVFAGNGAEFVNEALRRCRLDLLQFSAGESPEFCGSFSKPTVIVVHSSTSTERRGHGDCRLPDAQALAKAHAVALMVDARAKGLSGGTGVRVPIDVAVGLRLHASLPFILAGGLTPENVAAAVAAVAPWGVDVRSGVERDGKKDPGLVERFVRAAKRSNGSAAVEFIRPLRGTS